MWAARAATRTPVGRVGWGRARGEGEEEEEEGLERVTSRGN